MGAAAELNYSGPNEKNAPLEQFYFTQWKKGDVPFVAAVDANLRRQPSAGSEVVAQLSLGSKVKVLSVATEATRVGERVDRWYRVQPIGSDKGGFLFGSTLTAAAFEIDFDNDGEKEWVTVAWTSSYKIRVRVWEPGAPAGKATTALSIQPSGQAYVCCGGNLSVSAVDTATAGLALLAIASSVEACADFGTAYVSYSGSTPKTVGRLRLALEISGLTDPPTYADSDVEFLPKQRQARVISRSWVDEDEGGTGEANAEKYVTMYRLRNGVFLEIEK